MPTDEINIKIEAKTREALRNMDKVNKKQEEIVKDNKSFLDKMKANWLALGAAIAGVFVGIKKAFDITKESARFEQSMTAARKQFGKDGDLIIKKLKEVTGGTISNADLIQSANRTMSLNVTKDIDKMAKLYEIARVRAQAMGIDTNFAVESISLGIGRMSPLILDNLGIITKGWAEEAKAAGLAFDQQFILNKVLKDGAELIERTGGVVLTNAERIQQFETSIKNARLALGEALIPALTGLLKVIKPVIEAFTKLPSKLKAVLGVVIILAPALIALNIAAGPIGLILGAIAIAGLAVAAAFAEQNKEVDNATKSFGNLRKALFDQIDAIDQLVKLLRNFKNLVKEEREELGRLSAILGINNDLFKTQTDRRLTINRLLIRKKVLLEENNQLGKDSNDIEKEGNDIKTQTVEKLFELMDIEAIQSQVEKDSIKELNNLRREAFKLGFDLTKAKTKLTESELKKEIALRKKELDDFKKKEQEKAKIARQEAIARRQISDFLVSSVIDGFDEIEQGAKGVAASIVKAIGEALSGELAARAAASLALAFAPPPIGGPQHLVGAAQLTGASLIVKGIASAAASKILSAQKGADFVTNGPQLVMVGDNASGRERVQVTPAPIDNSISEGDIIIENQVVQTNNPENWADQMQEFSTLTSNKMDRR